MNKTRWCLGAALALATVSSACATGSDSFFSEGAGGGGVGGAGGAGSTSAVTGATSTTTSTSGSSSTSTTSTGSTSSTTTSTSSGGPECAADQHLCGGICAGNTPATGCFGSVTCAACAAAPIHGTTSCSAAGTCDFTCGAGYMKSGNACVCAADCCSDSDCGGQVCISGVCTDPPPMCDPVACIFTCFIQGLLGVCNGNVCECM